ncbi:MAG: type III pantothenate kinase [Candidatus Aminicenantes bacterium]|nr:type III pantothenate kinase [Candidatus Aminicenantes bacterium]
MLLTIDVGNTTTGVAIFNNGEIVFRNKLATPGDEVTEKFLKSLIKRKLIGKDDGIIISSVVPLVDNALEAGIVELFGIKPLFVDHRTETGLKICIDRPEELGADLIAGAVGGLHFFEPPLMVIDSGTATTYGIVNKDYEYIGGAILPGVEISIRSLSNNAAKLNRIHFKKPASIVGRNTEDCIRAGIFYSNLGGLDFMIKEYKKALGKKTKVIVTGGLIRHFKDLIEGIDLYEPDLLYYGLKKIFEMQQ